MTYQPKGSMCMSCTRKFEVCKFDFSKMKVIKVYPDGVKAVKCEHYNA
jgi:hypothetical protein